MKLFFLPAVPTGADCTRSDVTLHHRGRGDYITHTHTHTPHRSSATQYDGAFITKLTDENTACDTMLLTLAPISHC